jgi:hypothetical protein
LYDLEKDPNELTNLYNQKEVAEVTRELKEAMQRKMILDFDYLPLPIPAANRKTQAIKKVFSGQ